MAKGRECENASGPFDFRGCDLTTEYLSATEEVRVQFPAAAPIPCKLRVSTRPSPQNSAQSGQHGGSLPFSFRGRGRQVMHLPCKQAYAGALPADSTISLRGTRLKHRGRCHKPFEAGVIPAPATNFREVIRLPDCKSGVAKQSRKRRTGALPALPTIYGVVAQSAERPVVCGRVEGAIRVRQTCPGTCFKERGSPSQQE